MKTVTVTLNIPDDYNWIAQQPFGVWMVFQRRPKIYRGQEQVDDCAVEYWECQIGEMAVTSDAAELVNANQITDWKKSVRKI